MTTDGTDLTVDLAINEFGKQSFTLSAPTSTHAVLQLWHNAEEGQTGVRLDGAETERETFFQRPRPANHPFVDTLTVGGFAGEIGPLMWSTVAPSPDDRAWLENGGAYRSFSEISTRVVSERPLLVK